MENNFGFWQKGKEEEKNRIDKHLEQNTDSIGFDDNFDIDQEIINRKFINKENFEIEDLSKVQELLNSLFERDKKLATEIDNLKKETSKNIEDFEMDFNVNENQEKLSEEDENKFINFLKNVPSESYKRRILLESRLDISISLLSLFDKSVQLFENIKNYAEDEEASKAFSFALITFKSQSEQAKSVYRSIKSELLEIDKMEKIRNSFLERKQVSDYLKRAGK